MLFFVGMIVVFASVIVGYVMSHGNLWALWQPYELLIICGSAIGAFILGTPGAVIKKTMAFMPRAISGGGTDKAMFLDVLSLVYDILNKARREGFMSIEEEVESPESSPIFSRYPAIQANTELAHFTADYFRIVAGGNITPFQLEALMDQEIEARHHELSAPAVAVGRVADALPGFGIVAAVLGIVITMGAIDGEISEIGAHVAAALVGTFTGVFLAYGVVGPIGALLQNIADEEIKLYEAVRSSVIAALNGLAPQVAVEFGRKSLFPEHRPSFAEVESKVRGR